MSEGFSMRKNVGGLAFAGLIVLLGFLMFVKPHLGSAVSKPTAAAVQTVAADAESVTAAKAAFATEALSSESLAKSLSHKSQTSVQQVVATPVAGSGNGIIKVHVTATGSIATIGSYLANLGKDIYIDPDSHQIRGPGPLFQVSNLSWSAGDSGPLTSATFDITVYTAAAAPAASAPTTTTTSTTP
jgi:hypothetical protein